MDKQLLAIPDIIDSDYTTLMCSLPFLPPPFAEELVPISRRQLQNRIHMLDDDHAELLSEIEQLLQWDRISIEQGDNEILDRAKRLQEKLYQPTLLEAVQWRMDMRGIVSALRQRLHNNKQPEKNRRSHYGRFHIHIERHWNAPYFQLEWRFPWLKEVARGLKESQAMRVEQALLNAAWQQLSNDAQQHHFNYVAVVLYVLRWNIVERCSQYSQQAGLEHYRRLEAEGLGQYQHLFTHSE